MHAAVSAVIVIASALAASVGAEESGPAKRASFFGYLTPASNANNSGIVAIFHPNNPSGKAPADIPLMGGRYTGQLKEMAARRGTLHIVVEFDEDRRRASVDSLICFVTEPRFGGRRHSVDPTPDEQRMLRTLVRRLSDDSFDIRERAERELLEKPWQWTLAFVDAEPTFEPEGAIRKERVLRAWRTRLAEDLMKSPDTFWENAMWNAQHRTPVCIMLLRMAFAMRDSKSDDSPSLPVRFVQTALDAECFSHNAWGSVADCLCNAHELNPPVETREIDLGEFDEKKRAALPVLAEMSIALAGKTEGTRVSVSGTKLSITAVRRVHIAFHRILMVARKELEPSSYR